MTILTDNGPITRDLVDALERVTENFKRAVAGKPVRDMAETLAEVDRALNAARSQGRVEAAPMSESEA